MKKPKRRWPAPALLLPISLWLFFAGCAGHRPPCVPLAAGEFAAVPPPPSFHWVVSGTLKQGLLAMDFDGDILFVPPDTCRLICRTSWGETLLDLKAFGDSLVWFRLDRPGLSRTRVPPPAARQLRMASYAAVGRGLPFDSTRLTTECTREGLAVVADSLRFLLDPVDHRLRQIDLPQFSASLAAGDDGKAGEPPSRFQFQYRKAFAVDLRIVKRDLKPPQSGLAILN